MTSMDHRDIEPETVEAYQEWQEWHHWLETDDRTYEERVADAIAEYEEPNRG